MDENTKLAYELIEKHGVDRYPTVGDALHKLVEEVGEVFYAYLRDLSLDAELADIELCLRIIAHKAGVDLDAAVREKVSSDTRVVAADGKNLE